MKQKFLKWSSALLTTCMGLGWFVGFDTASVLLLGEYPYPQDEEK